MLLYAVRKSAEHDKWAPVIVGVDATKDHLNIYETESQLFAWQ